MSNKIQSKIETHEKLSFDQEVKLKELSLKEKEFELLKESNKKIDTVRLGVIVAIIGLFGNALVSFINGNNQISSLERELQNNLIISAVGNESIEANKRNLNFLLNAGLIPDYENNIEVLLQSPDSSLKFIVAKQYDSFKEAIENSNIGSTITFPDKSKVHLK